MCWTFLLYPNQISVSPRGQLLAANKIWNFEVVGRIVPRLDLECSFVRTLYIRICGYRRSVFYVGTLLQTYDVWLAMGRLAVQKQKFGLLSCSVWRGCASSCYSFVLRSESWEWSLWRRLWNIEWVVFYAFSSSTNYDSYYCNSFKPIWVNFNCRTKT